MPTEPTPPPTIADRLHDHALLLPADDPTVPLLLDAAESLELIWTACGEAMRRLRYPEHATAPAAMEMMAISTDLGRAFIESRKIEPS